MSDSVIYPEHFRDDIKLRPKMGAEHKVFQQLKSEYQHSFQDVKIYHSPMWVPIGHDIDFAILDRRRDLILVEVKGGTEIKGNSLIQNGKNDISEDIRVKHKVMHEVYEALIESTQNPTKRNKKPFLKYKKVLILPDAISIPKEKAQKATFGTSSNGDKKYKWDLVLSMKELDTGLRRHIERAIPVKRKKESNQAARLHANKFEAACEFLQNLAGEDSVKNNGTPKVQTRPKCEAPSLTPEEAIIPPESCPKIDPDNNKPLDAGVSFTRLLPTLTLGLLPIWVFSKIGLLWVGILCGLCLTTLLIYLFAPFNRLNS